MSLIALPKKDQQTTLREMLRSYLPAAEKDNKSASIGVRYIRHLAQHILQQTQDIADQPFDAGHEHVVGLPIFKFINGEWTRALAEAEKEKGDKVSEADVVARINDDIAQNLAKELRKRVMNATSDS